MGRTNVGYHHFLCTFNVVNAVTVIDIFFYLTVSEEGYISVTENCKDLYGDITESFMVLIQSVFSYTFTWFRDTIEMV